MARVKRPRGLPLRHPGVAAIIALGFSLLPLATDTTVAALPGLRAHFGVSISLAQLTLSAFMAAFAVSQLVYGPLSDRFGRRPILLGGLAVFLLASLACTLAASIEGLIVARFFQAVGCCAPTVIGRAIVRDVHGAEGTARMMAYISAGMSLLICLWPIVGGQLVQQFGWRAVFALHALVGGGMFATAAFLVTESNPHLNPAATEVLRTLRNYRTLLADRRFVGYAACNAFSFGAVVSFLSGAPFVLIGRLGIAAWEFGLLLGLAIIGYVLGTLTTARLVTRIGIDRMLRAGSAVGAAAGAGMFALALAGVHTVAAVIVPYFVFLLATGLNQPSAMAGAIGPFPRMAGTSSALLGFVQLASGASIGFIVGKLDHGTPVPMAAAIALCTLGVLASYYLIVRRGVRK